MKSPNSPWFASSHALVGMNQVPNFSFLWIFPETLYIPSSKSIATAFGSIARLLDSPTTSSSSRNSPNTISASTTGNQSTNHNNSLNQFYLSGSGGPSSVPQSQSCSSRSLSPRSHSPPRERDSYRWGSFFCRTLLNYLNSIKAETCQR